MSETVLREDEFTEEAKALVRSSAPADWDGGDFHDVTKNDALNPHYGSEPETQLLDALIKAPHAWLTYGYPDGRTTEQPIEDIGEVGTLVDEDSGDDLEIIGVRIDISDEKYQALTEVIDRVKLDATSLDTDQYAGMVLDALGFHH